MSLAGILNRLLTQRQNAVLSLLPACTKFKYYSNKPPEPIIIEGVPVSAVAQKKTKRPVVPRITLITGKDDVSVMTLEEAQKMSARRNLKLVKVLDFDTKSQRPVYKLMTAAEYTAEDIKQRKMKKSSSAYKGEKVLMLSSVIANHDLETQIKKIEKWVAKEYEVHVTISGNANNPEKNVRTRYLI